MDEFMDPMQVGTFEDTVDLMLSFDYKDRMKAEIKQLKIRMKRLADMLDRYYEGNLEFELSCPPLLLQKQLKAMDEYLSYLLIRAAIEKVEL